MADIRKALDEAHAMASKGAVRLNFMMVEGRFSRTVAKAAATEFEKASVKLKELLAEIDGRR